MNLWIPQNIFDFLEFFPIYFEDFNGISNLKIKISYYE